MDQAIAPRRGRFVWMELPERPCPPRCPRCGVGDLLRARLLRAPGQATEVDYCAGIYDRGRRRLARPGCGYNGL